MGTMYNTMIVVTWHFLEILPSVQVPGLQVLDGIDLVQGQWAIYRSEHVFKKMIDQVDEIADQLHSSKSTPNLPFDFLSCQFVNRTQ